jgi:hypothetical protein
LNFSLWVLEQECNKLFQSLQQAERRFSGRDLCHPEKAAGKGDKVLACFAACFKR